MSNGGIIGTYNSGIWSSTDISLERDKIRKGMVPRQGSFNKLTKYNLVGRRKFEDTMVSLMHFNYPYTSEVGDGMRDEVNKLEWSVNGAAKFVGVEEPVAQVVADTPKFGWRCLQTAANTDYISATDEHGILNIVKGSALQIEMFVRILSQTTGNVLQLLKDDDVVFSITLSPSTITVIGDGINTFSSEGPTTLNWNHILVKIYGGFCQIYMNGIYLCESRITSGTIEANEIRLGGFPGQIDEFKMQMKSSGIVTPVPEQPYQCSIPAANLGGFGNGERGDVVISETDVDINTTAIVQNKSQILLALGTKSIGVYGDFIPGDKVMIHVSLNKSTETEAKDLGKYSIRNIVSITNDNIQLDKAIDEFILDPYYYYVQIIKIPQFNNLLVDRNASIVPVAWNTTTGGGMVAFTVLNDCEIIGNITTQGKGITRIDNNLFCHEQIQNNFLLSGNVFILCKETLTISGYIGGDWDGDTKGGAGGTYSPHTSESFGEDGCLGYGGKSYLPTVSAGGKPGNNGILSPNTAGAFLILICNKILVNKKSLSSGGKYAWKKYTGYIEAISGGAGYGGGGGCSQSGQIAGGGGGTGFCYIACNEMLEGDNTLTTIEPIRYAQDTVEF